MRTIASETVDVRLRSKKRLFRARSRMSHREVRIRLYLFACETEHLQVLGHEEPVRYLDLAVEPCLRSMRGDHVRFEAIRRLPPAVAEYLIAESALTCDSVLGEILERVSRTRERRVQKCELKRELSSTHFFCAYSGQFLERIGSFDRIRWTRCIRRFLRVYALLQVPFLESSHYASVMRAICTRPEPDPALTIEVLRALCINHDHQKSEAFSEAPFDCLETILCHAKVMRFDFWGMWRGIGRLSHKYNPVSDFIFDGLNTIAELLLDYGFPHPPAVRPSCPNTKSTHAGDLIKRFVPLDKQRHFELKIRDARPRLCMYIFMAFTYDDGTERMAKRTLVSLMRCVPEPYVTPKDVRDELASFLNDDGFDHLITACQSYEAVYKEMWGERANSNEIEPRALKHLCRCVVRSCLTDNLRLPEGINELPVPMVVKDFLLLRC